GCLERAGRLARSGRLARRKGSCPLPEGNRPGLTPAASIHRTKKTRSVTSPEKVGTLCGATKTDVSSSDSIRLSPSSCCTPPNRCSQEDNSMRADRRWTIMLVPNGCDAARTIIISSRAIRRAVRLAGGAVVLVAVLLGAAFTRSSLTSAPPKAPSRAFQARLDGLLDTIETIARRDAQIRL